MAAQQGRAEVVAFLCEAGADVDRIITITIISIITVTCIIITIIIIISSSSSSSRMLY